MKIAIVTDAWHPQINGVVTALSQTEASLRRLGHEVAMVTPEGDLTVPCPTYPEIRLSLSPRRRVREVFEGWRPDAVHIATEGPLGLYARAYCLKQGWRFTSSFHTRFPEYISARIPLLPVEWGYGYLRWFHDAAVHTLVSNAPLAEELHGWGLARVKIWPRGVNTELFRPLGVEQGKTFLKDPRPISMYLGRVSVEKNVEAFLALELPGTKYVVGDGPARAELQARYPQVRFTGFKTGEELVRHLSAADVFVFPSRTDTLGLVLYEANACGLPVAAYPVVGPQSIVINGVNGYLDEDLGVATLQALELDPQVCRAEAMKHSWEGCSEVFASLLVPARPG